MIENKYCKECEEGTLQYIEDSYTRCTRCGHEEKS